MKRLLALSILCAACDPIVSVSATVTAPVEVQGATFPQELVLELGGFDAPRRVFVLCEPSDVPIQASLSSSHIGCFEPSTVRAWLTPFTPAQDEVVVCGAQPSLNEFEETPGLSASLDPQETDPSAEETLFVEESQSTRPCIGGNAEVELVLSF